MSNSYSRSGELCSTSIFSKGRYLHRLLGTLLHRRFVSSYISLVNHLFIYIIMDSDVLCNDFFFKSFFLSQLYSPGKSHTIFCTEGKIWLPLFWSLSGKLGLGFIFKMKMSCTQPSTVSGFPLSRHPVLLAPENESKLFCLVQ